MFLCLMLFLTPERAPKAGPALVSFLILDQSQPDLLIKHILIRKKECTLTLMLLRRLIVQGTVKKGKVPEKKWQTAVALGEIAWDQMFVEGGLALATTSFIEKLSKAISEEDFQSINKEVNKTLQGEKDDFCSQSYCSLTEAKDKLYSLLTETFIE